MRKLLSLLLVLTLLLAAVPAFADNTYEIALVTDVGNIDDQSFNQSSWEGVVKYAEEFGVSYNYYRPSEDSTEARVETIKAAIDKGAKVVVCPGYLFEAASEVRGREAGLKWTVERTARVKARLGSRTRFWWPTVISLLQDTNHDRFLA